MNYSSNNGQKIKKVKFTPEEDAKLISLVGEYGENDWQSISSLMDGRNVRQCRERWRHYLSPEISKAPWSNQEDQLLAEKYAEYGPKWKLISEFFPKRTYISIKNRFLLKQREMKKMSRFYFQSSAYLRKKFKKQFLKEEQPIIQHNDEPVIKPSQDTFDFDISEENFDDFSFDFGELPFNVYFGN